MGGVVPQLGQVLADGDVVHPGLQPVIEELLPCISHMEHQRAAQEEVLEPEAGRHSAEIKQIPAGQRDRTYTTGTGLTPQGQGQGRGCTSERH